MTGRELFEQLEKEGLADKPLFTLIEVVEEYSSWCDTDKITEWFTIDDEVFLGHEFYFEE